MKCKKPVLTFKDSGGPTELISNGINGFVIEPEPEALAEKIEILFSNKKKASELGEAGFETAKAFTWEKTISRLIIT